MNILPRFIIRRFLPGYIAGFAGFGIYTAITNLQADQQPTILNLGLLLSSVATFLCMLYWAYWLEKQQK